MIEIQTIWYQTKITFSELFSIWFTWMQIYGSMKHDEINKMFKSHEVHYSAVKLHAFC